MTSYLFLGAAILFEVSGTLLLPVTQNFSRPFPTIGMVVCYLLAFYCLTFAIKQIPIAIVYAIWSGIGVMLIAIFSAYFYKQMLPWYVILGLIFIVLGVALVNLYVPKPQ